MSIETQIAETVEIQLCQLFLYIGAIEALLETHRAHPHLHNDNFLFGTVYDGLWDAAIVRFANIWDKTNGAASLRKLAGEIKKYNTQEAITFKNEVDKETPKQALFINWRNKVVAHVQRDVDPSKFEGENSAKVTDLRKEAELAQELLDKANKIIGRKTAHLEILKEDAISDARKSLSLWSKGLDSVLESTSHRIATNAVDTFQP